MKPIATRAAIQTLLTGGLFAGAGYLSAGRALTVWEWLALLAGTAGVAVLCWAQPLMRLAAENAKLEGSTAAMTERFEGLLKSQKRFLGDVAHELNAPIARVQFALGVIEETVGDPHREDVQALHDEVQEMSALVQELLAFSKAGVEAGTMPLAAVNLRSVVQRAADRENTPVEIAVDASIVATAHELYLMRALCNLLRNARRYAGHAGPIEVRASRSGDAVEVVVADHGPGVPEAELEQVFEPFYRLDASRTTSTGGKGLGMAIVKSCVEACRGTVICRNRKPSGLEVVIRLAAGPER